MIWYILLNNSYMSCHKDFKFFLSTKNQVLPDRLNYGFVVI